MIPAPEIPRSATPFVAISLALVAGLGGYFGYSHATPPPGGDQAATTTAVAAKTATAIPDSAPAAAVPDEAFIRRIAREEAEAALHPKHVAPSPEADDDASDAPYQPAPTAAQPSPPPPASPPQAPTTQDAAPPPA